MTDTEVATSHPIRRGTARRLGLRKPVPRRALELDEACTITGIGVQQWQSLHWVGDPRLPGVRVDDVTTSRVYRDWPLS